MTTGIPTAHFIGLARKMSPIANTTVMKTSRARGHDPAARAGSAVINREGPTPTKSEKEETRKNLEEKSETLKTLLEAMQKHLDEHVKEVRLSGRLTTSPACLVSAEYDMSPQLERLLRHTQQEVPRTKRILELNADHEVVGKLKERFEKDADDPKVRDAADLLFGYALLAEGSELPDPARFTGLVAELMADGF